MFLCSGELTDAFLDSVGGLLNVVVNSVQYSALYMEVQVS